MNNSQCEDGPRDPEITYASDGDARMRPGEVTPLASRRRVIFKQNQIFVDIMYL